MYVHPNDREEVKEALEKQTLIDHLDRNGSLTLTYRFLSDNGRVQIASVSAEDAKNAAYIYARMVVSRMKEESIAYARLSALSGEYVCVYVVDSKDGRYREYSARTGFEILAIPKEGKDFFGTSRKEGCKVVYEEDLERYLAMFTHENVMAEIKRSGFFSLTYRLVLNSVPNYVQLKAVLLEEREGLRLIVGVSNIDAYVRQEEEYARRLEMAHSEADIDPLTGIRNRHAYLEAEEQLNHQISEGAPPAFAIVVLDVNDLKKVNDTEGHQAGDRFICRACRIICDIFKHSPVFRVGGDEFTVIAQGDDYEDLAELIQRINDHNREAKRAGGIVIACGMSWYENDTSVAPVYERADHEMYENKSSLKGRRG